VSAVVAYLFFLHPSSFLPLFLYFSISVSRSCFRDWFAISSSYSFILSSFPSQEKMLTKNFMTAQSQNRPEGDNIQFNCTAVISSMYLKQQSVYRLATGWTVRESKPGGR
jgi:hypothetical protein